MPRLNETPTSTDESTPRRCGDLTAITVVIPGGPNGSGTQVAVINPADWPALDALLVELRATREDLLADTVEVLVVAPLGARRLDDRKIVARCAGLHRLKTLLANLEAGRDAYTDQPSADATTGAAR